MVSSKVHALGLRLLCVAALANCAAQQPESAPQGSPGEARNPRPAPDESQDPLALLPPSVQAEPGEAERTWSCTFTWTADEPVTSVYLVGDFNDWDTTATPLARGGDGRLRVRLTLANGVHLYKFHVDGERWLPDPANPLSEPDGHGGSNSVLPLGPDAGQDPTRPSVKSLSTLSTPEWARHAIWYQILLDRFRNGSPRSDPDPVRPWRSEWTAHSDFEGRDGQTFWEYFVYRRRYGGDLTGLTERLDYLKDLGVNALYLNPIFQASTYHGYDAVSFVHVDERFGARRDFTAAEAREDVLDPSTWTWTDADKMFLEFLAAAHERGFKVVLDGVFNHVGTAHATFRDVRERGEDSPFADWFEVRSWEPFEYAGWAGYGELPVFKKGEDGFHADAVEEHILAITRRWMDPDGDGDPADGIDGWRLDVPNEVAMPFWARWREHAKAINPDAYLTGEIWDRADEWLDGRHFDAVMNYPFARAALSWVGDKQNRILTSELDGRLAELRNAYPDAATEVMMNLVGSHDTDRLASMLKNPDREYDAGNREQDGAQYDGSKPRPVHYRRARLIALMQMTYIGAPMIYYGDEVGMWGADDPACRKPMLWKDLEPYDAPEDRVDEAHLAHFKRVIALRREYSALRDGTFETILCDDQQEVWVFRRENEEQEAIVALNAARRPGDLVIPALTTEFQSVLGDTRRDLDGNAHIPAVGGRVWVRSK